MAVTGTLTATGDLFGLPGGILSPFLQWVITNGTGDVRTVSVSTNTAISIPTGSTLVAFIPPTGNANALTLKGIAGDTGIAISKTKPTLLSVDSAVTSCVLNAAGATAVQVICV